MHRDRFVVRETWPDEKAYNKPNYHYASQTRKCRWQHRRRGKITCKNQDSLPSLIGNFSSVQRCNRALLNFRYWLKVKGSVVQPEETHDNKDGAQTKATVAEETVADRRKRRSPVSRQFWRSTDPRPAKETIAPREKRGALVFQPIGGAIFYPAPTEGDDRTNCSII